MGPIAATMSCLSKPLTFEGRAGLGEYWWFFLVYLVTLIAGVAIMFAPLILVAFYQAQGQTAGATATDLEGAVMGLAFGGGAIAYGLVAVYLHVAQLSVTVRRLHDTDRSGWWYWICLVPFIGGLLLLILMLIPGDMYRNSFGHPNGGARRPEPRHTGIPEVPRDPIEQVRGSEAIRQLRLARMQHVQDGTPKPV